MRLLGDRALSPGGCTFARGHHQEVKKIQLPAQKGVIVAGQTPRPMSQTARFAVLFRWECLPESPACCFFWSFPEFCSFAVWGLLFCSEFGLLNVRSDCLRGNYCCRLILKAGCVQIRSLFFYNIHFLYTCAGGTCPGLLKRKLQILSIENMIFYGYILYGAAFSALQAGWWHPVLKFHMTEACRLSRAFLKLPEENFKENQ